VRDKNVPARKPKSGSKSKSVNQAKPARQPKRHQPKQEKKPGWRHFNFVTAGPVDDYLYSLLPARDAVLVEMEEYASKHNVPIVGPAVARVLQQLALMINARTVFELGSAIGYSTIWWAQAVGEGGRVIYTDGDPKNAERARDYFARAGVSGRVTLHTGDALEVLSEQKQQFDIIFNDVDKEDYPRVLRLVSQHLRKGGLFITDNVLWSGRVAKNKPKDATTEAILEFNRQLYSSADFYTTILPIRDGLAVALKK
jgi:caffeoyl-CoA O-methyltransferase